MATLFGSRHPHSRRSAWLAMAIAGALALAVVPVRASYADSTVKPPVYQLLSTGALNGGLTSDIAGSAYIDEDGGFHWSTGFTGYGSDPSQGWAKTFSNDNLAAVSTGLGTSTTQSTMSAYYATPGSLCYQLDKRSVNAIPSPQEDDHCDLIGVWVDPQTGTWHALLNDEYQFDPWNTAGDGATVADRIGTGVHNDRVLLATSKDKGVSWQYDGPALTSGWDHNGIVDSVSSPGGTWPFGISGPRLFVDYSSGYFYVVYNVKIYTKPGGGTLASWDGIARAPISGKMATGTWTKYYNGSWSQPGIGGIDGNMGSSLGLTVHYNPATDVVDYTGKGLDHTGLDITFDTVSAKNTFTFADASGTAYTANTATYAIHKADGTVVPSVRYRDPATGQQMSITTQADVTQSDGTVVKGGIAITQTDPSTGAARSALVNVQSDPVPSYYEDTTTHRLFIPFAENTDIEPAISYNVYTGTYRMVDAPVAPNYQTSVGSIYETSDLGDPTSWKVVGLSPTGSTGPYLTTLDRGSLTNQNVTGTSYLTVADFTGAVAAIQSPAGPGIMPMDSTGATVATATPYSIYIGGTGLRSDDATAASQWKLVPITDSHSPSGTGFFRLQNATSGKFLQVTGSSASAQRAIGAQVTEGSRQPDSDPTGNGGLGSPGGSDQWYVQLVAPDAQAGGSTSLAGSTTYRVVNRNSGLALEFSNGSFWLEQQNPGDVCQYAAFSTSDANAGSSDHTQCQQHIVAWPRTTTISAPSSVAAATAFTVTTVFKNGATGGATNVTNSLTVPTGWTATPTSTATFARVAAASTVSTTWTVVPSADVAGGSTSQLSAQTSYTDGSPSTTPKVSTSISGTYASLAAAFNRVGVTDNADPGPGNFDGSGYSYSAQSLAAVGITPGKQVPGTDFTWPNVSSGQPDMVSAAGQGVSLSGAQGSMLSFLGASHNSTNSGTVTVYYADGSSSTGTLTFANWVSNAAATGTTLVATETGWNEPTGSPYPASQKVSLYSASIPVNPDKSISYITLPQNTALNVFAISVQ